MDEGTLGFGHTSGLLVPLALQAVAWLVVVVACAVAVRRPWAWTGLPGGLLGLVVSVTYLADEIALRSDLGKPSAHVFDGDDTDFPGFLLDHDLYAPLAWGQGLAVALVAAALVTGAVLSRRARRD